MVTQSLPYPARLTVDYPESLNRVSTLFRLIWAIPIVVILAVVTSTAGDTVTVISDGGEVVSRITTTGLGIAGGLFVATMMMIVFRQRYPRWWFDFSLALNRFSNRVGAYMGLLTDQYPSTEAEQSVHLDLDYPNVEQDLSRWMPLVKWLLAIPHYIVLAVLGMGAVFAILIAWFAILITGRYPRALFDYVVGVGRWALRVQAYSTLLITDRYPPFSLR